MNTPFFALRRAAVLTLTLLLAFVLAACANGGDTGNGGDGGTDASADAGGSGTATVEGGAVEVSADNLEFDVTTIEAPAGEDFTITLVNNDTAPHNISVYTEEGGDLIGEEGPTAEGGQTVETQVSALEPGTYYFQCDIHPDMNGQLVVEG